MGRLQTIGPTSRKPRPNRRSPVLNAPIPRHARGHVRVRPRRPTLGGGGDAAKCLTERRVETSHVAARLWNASSASAM